MLTNIIRMGVRLIIFFLIYTIYHFRQVFLGRKPDTDTRISKARLYRVDFQWFTSKYPPPVAQVGFRPDVGVLTWVWV